MYTCIYIYVYIYIYIERERERHLCIYIYIYTYICIYSFILTCIHVYGYVCVYIYIYIYTYIFWDFVPGQIYVLRLGKTGPGTSSWRANLEQSCFPCMQTLGREIVHTTTSWNWLLRLRLYQNRDKSFYTPPPLGGGGGGV